MAKSGFRLDGQNLALAVIAAATAHAVGLLGAVAIRAAGKNGLAVAVGGHPLANLHLGWSTLGNAHGILRSKRPQLGAAAVAVR